MTDCIFCKIVKKELPSYKIYEDDEFLAFLDIFPKNKGHALVITKQHYETTHDIPKETLEKFIIVADKISQQVKESMKADGYNLFINNGKEAGQEVPHAHFHIIPRYKNDGLPFNWPTKKFSEEEFKAAAEQIKKAKSN